MECGGPNVFCPPGSTQPYSVGSGYYAINATRLSSPNSTFSDRTPCLVGYECLGNDFIRACSPGFYTDQPKSSMCLPCGTGFYNNASASSSCFPCDYGKASTLPGSSFCDDCDIGSYALNGSSSCKPCLCLLPLCIHFPCSLLARIGLVNAVLIFV